jgi:TonB-dependent receptor
MDCRAAGRVLVVTLGLGFSAHWAAAEDHGRIQGRVADFGGTPLPGAAVHLDPGNLSTRSDRDGSFTFPNVMAGAYKVEITYIGYVTATEEVRVSAGGEAEVEVKLRPAVSIAESVKVTASRVLGEVEALNQQKNADNIIDVLPAEVITSLPNLNVADAIGRLPSVSLERDEGEGKFVQVRGLESRYTNATVNGVHIPASLSGGREMKLDAFPSDLVGAIELQKTISADQDGDAIGGSVNLVTKIAGDQPSLTLSTEGGYTNVAGGRGLTQFNGTYTDRFGPDKKLGLVVGGTYDWNGRGINDMEPGAAVTQLPDGRSINSVVAGGVDYREYRYKRSRYGAAGGLDYRLGSDSSLYLRGLFAEFHNYGDRWVTSISPGAFLTPTLTDNSGGYSGNVQNRTPNEQTYSISAGGRHDLGTALLDYSLSYSHARQNVLDHRQASFAGPSAAFQVDTSNTFLPKLTPLNGVNQLDASQYSVTDFQLQNDRTADRDAAVALNVAFPYKAGSNSGELKIGGKYRDEHKTNNLDERYFNATGNPTFMVSQGIDASIHDPHYYGGAYPQGPDLSLTAITNFFNSTPGAFEEDISKDHIRSDPNNYDVTEKIAAFYVKNTIKLDKLHVIAGVRVERTDAVYDGFRIDLDENDDWVSTRPANGASKYTDALPSIQLRYEIDPNTNLRAVYGWAVSRPNYADLVPSLQVQNANVFRKEVSAGNPNLKPTKGQNYDLLLEHYFGSIGAISGGAFYKGLKNPIYPGSETMLTGGPFAGYTQIQPINGPSAKIYGAEVAWQQHLTFLPGVLSGLGVIANYTYTNSKATFDPSTGRTGTAQLQRTTPNEFNFGLTFDRGRLSVRGAATYNSATIFGYAYKDGADGGLTGPNGDTYLFPHTQIDAQGSYTFKNGFQIFVSALNINNEVFGFYNGSPQWFIQREFYKPTVSVGFKLIR